MVAVLAPPSARADDTHYQDFIVGGRAVSLGGAFCAIADDPSGLYYNPAGLADVRFASLQVSSSLYGFERGTLEDRVGVPVPGIEDLNVEFTDLIVIPASAGFVNGFGDEGPSGEKRNAYALSVIVPSYRSFSAASGGAPGDDSAYRRRVTDRSLWSGLGVARNFGGGLRLGVGAFYVLRSVVDLEELTVTDDGASTNARFQTVTNDVSLVNGSVVVVAGAKLSLTKRLTLGLALHAPSLQVHSQGTLLFTRGTSDPAASRSELQRVVIDDVQSETKNAGSLRAGLAWVEPYRFTLSADVSAHAPVSYDVVRVTDPAVLARLPFTPSIERRPVVNFNAGAEFLIIKQVSIAAGWFTDFSSAEPIPDAPLADQPPRVDLMGLTMALGYFGEHTLSRLGVVYSFGAGKDVIPTSDVNRLAEGAQEFARVDYAQSFFYIFLSSTFRY